MFRFNPDGSIDWLHNMARLGHCRSYWLVLLFGITTAEALMVISVLLLLFSIAMTVAQFRRG